MATFYRWAYVKNGDVVSQLKSLGGTPDVVPEGGPNAFIGDFLHGVAGQPVLLLSCHRYNETLVDGQVEAHVYQYEGKFLFGFFHKALLRFFVFLSIARRLISFRPERIICGRTGAMLWLSFLVAKLFSIGLVHSRHNRVVEDKAHKLRRVSRQIDNWIIKRCTAVICHGPYLKKQLLQVGIPARKIFEFDVGFKDFIKEKKDIPRELLNFFENKREIILFVGRIEENKGIFDLLQASKDVLQKSEGTSLIFVGDGRHLQQLRQEINSKRLMNKVCCVGKVPHDVLPSILRLCKVLVVPTKSDFPEGRCMAAMEGLVLGVPLIVPNFGPFPFLVTDHHDGLLFEANSRDDLKKKLEIIFNDHELYFKLQNGAETTGKQLMFPEMTFFQAVEKAFLIDK